MAEDSWRAIECVAHHGMPDRAHVHANLVRTSGFDVNVEQGKLTV